jgi:Flp pilus assembly protein TadG
MNYWFIRRLRTEDKGMAAVEFALILPVLLVMLAGIYDVSNMILCENKVNQTAQDLNNVITRGNLTKAQLDAILKVATLIMQPFDFNANGKVIVSSYSQVNANPPPTLKWTDFYGGGAGTTQITPGSLPGGIVLNKGQTIIFTEVFYTYTGVFTNYAFTSKSLYQLAAGVPRQGTMTTLP